MREKLFELIDIHWPLANSEFVPRYGSVLVASNHPPFPRLVPLINSLGLIRSDLVVIADAVMAYPIKLIFEKEVIEINAENNVSWAKDISERRKMQMVRNIGKTAGVYRSDGSQFATTAINQTLIQLDNDKIVMIAPSGQNSNVARWKSGYGAILKNLLQKGKDISLVMAAVTNKNGRYSIILSCDQLSKFKDQISGLSSHRISQYFQNYYDEQKSQLNN